MTGNFKGEKMSKAEQKKLQIKIEPNKDLFEEIYKLSQERDWSLKKTVEKIVDAYFQNKNT